MKDSKSTTLKNCELYFEDNKVKVVEFKKDQEEVEIDLIEDVLKKYENIQGLTIRISFDKEI